MIPKQNNKISINSSILLLLSVLFLFTGCWKEEIDIFPNSPAERLNQAMSTYESVLTSAENGWKMEYYANTQGGGYTLLMKFDASGLVTIASRSILTKNAAYEQDSSLYEVIADNGPVLTFNTFNKVLHVFSNPEHPEILDPYKGDLTGHGWQGDYEFIIKEAVEDTVWLKGKKYGAEIIMTKLSPEIQWQSYLDEVGDLDKMLFYVDMPMSRLKVDDVSYRIYKGRFHVFEIKKTDKESQQIPFIVTSTGIQFYQPIELNGVVFRNFELNLTKTKLVSVEHSDYAVRCTDDLAEFIQNNTKEFSWQFIPELSGNNFKNLYNRISNAVATAYEGEQLALNFEYSTEANSFVLVVSYLKDNEKVKGSLNLNIAFDEQDVLSISYANLGDDTGLQFYNEIDGLDELVSALTADFELSTGSKLNPWLMKCENLNDNTSFFRLERQVKN
ncbi:MAG TPA: DUF4302 domain-containing protein [Paludibacter sp.]|nr:MAG: hypothetical protein BWY08_01225 [Bacteroidetes bacterium ADurb.Bin174]HQB28324.1 DUF4302 domain-containing protein [Paludibacter sp.]